MDYLTRCDSGWRRRWRKVGLGCARCGVEGYTKTAFVALDGFRSFYLAFLDAAITSFMCLFNPASGRS
ncbi:hypothetical protein BCR44DRAFT_41415 [Catenaria anguillulae PL171]|uniref:Uncharacterized protein n=1 Tax=Catenaria anguillulae PL171 TaxID=765915 RepID=A0A1Y2HS81_9FUNG|nr:hypothetical protein BCR44DRAFT_41415 [Catenaria anguillulae PL171]